MDDEGGGMTERDMLPTLVRWFEDAEDQTSDARAKAERDRDYYDNKQYTSAELAELAARKQPAISDNRIRRKIDYLAGLEKQARQDPKAYPRNPQDEEAAEAATDAIRFVADQNRFPQVASRVWENELIEGAAGVDVCVEPGGAQGYRIKLNRVPWDRLFYDPHSSEPDFSDAKYLGIVLWMDEEDVLARWPGSEQVLETSYASQGYSDTYDDKPRFGVWADSKRKRVRVVQIYWNGPEGWQYASYTKGGYFDEAQPSPYVDEDGAPCCPLIFVSAYVDRDNARYGVVRDMIDQQDEINKRRSKALHLLSVRQVVMEDGAVQDVDVARRELAKPDGIIVKAPGMEFEIQQTADLAAGQAQLMQVAMASLDAMGPNATMQGKQKDQGASGIAIARSQQGGLIEVGTLLDMHRDWKRRVYEAVWQRIRQFWTAETWVRVTDDEANVRFVGLNVAGPPMFDEYTGQMMPGQMQNAVAETMVDIVIDEAPDVVTLQSEQFAALAELAKAGIPIPPDALIEASSLRNKERILDRMKEAQSGPPPPAVMETQRKAQRDQADVAIAAEELRIKDGELQLKAADLAQRQGERLMAAQQAMMQPQGMPA